MRNPWRMQDGPDNKINRNNFPMSFQYNGTFKYGKIYPIGLWRTIPGASYQIDSTLALNFMPTSFPVQTRQRAYVHFFYGRDRNFWKDYKDFVNGMNPELVKPYIDESITKARTGNLLDYLGVPTTIVGAYGNESLGSTIHLGEVNPISAFTSQTLYSANMSSVSNRTDAMLSARDLISSSLSDEGVSMIYAFPSYLVSENCTGIQFNVGLKSSVTNYLDIDSFMYNVPSETTNVSSGTASYSIPTPREENTFLSCIFMAISDKPFSESLSSYEILPVDWYQNGKIKFRSDVNLNGKYITLLNCTRFARWIGSQNAESVVAPSYYMELSSVHSLISQAEVRDIDETTSPYWRSGATTDLRNRIKLSAIPPRFYETVYNLYYRNPQNNPYILNGKPEYNQFIPTKDGGLDSNLYELRYRNWEDDFLTTAVQTPQQGIAPLVGLTDRGATVTLTNEDGSVTRYKTNLDEYGNVTGIETTDSSEPLLTQALIDAVSYGISIEDLRNVNAMQKWLELNLRKGYQYKDIIEARWGISISYNELDLPEFIGGFTQEVGLQAVTQTTSHGDGIEGALGWQAGRMYAAGSGRSIQHYCEEEGYIMALLCVVPVPNYSQLLPKHWFTRDLLDSYQPEFNHIGFQPITYKEVCPIQAYQESTENVDVLEQTFGYQRPWYEYFNQVDEVHGQFRTTFKDFLINRTFDVKPELSESFLLVDPNQINDVFAVTTDDDKIIGAIEHRITAKLPISLYAQARLE